MHRQRLFFSLSLNGNRERLAASIANGSLYRFAAVDRNSVNGVNHIAFLKAGIFCRTASAVGTGDVSESHDHDTIHVQFNAKRLTAGDKGRSCNGLYRNGLNWNNAE